VSRKKKYLEHDESSGVSHINVSSQQAKNKK
jgi:hypothetical protein